MNETCGMVHDMGICGKPAVEFVDILTPSGRHIRLYLCAYHYDIRDEILGDEGD